jgi:hypothetical protein
MIPFNRLVLAAALAVLMVVTGTSTYIFLGSRQSKAAVPPQKPTAATPPAQAFRLPGTLYLVQSGALYSLSAGRFHQLTPEQGWTQPALFPDGSNLLIVNEQRMFSNVYVMNRFGTIVRQITSNAAPPRNPDPGANHWSFYPRLSPDGQTLWMTYDGLKCAGCYDVSLAVWSMPLSGTIRQARSWTDGGYYTGGDVQPIPVPQGGVIYTKYDYMSNIDYRLDTKLTGMLWYTNRINSYGRELTDPGEDCRSPSLSPDGTQVAMVCTYLKQVSYLTIASWNGSSLGARRLIITDQLVAQPTWAPDGSGIAYLAPGVAAGEFQLWFLPRGAYAPPPPSPSPSPTPGGPHNGPLPTPTPPPPAPPVKPIQVTQYSGFDATSPLAWVLG